MATVNDKALSNVKSVLGLGLGLDILLSIGLVPRLELVFGLWLCLGIELMLVQGLN
jgi:hypothetical protein